jgi:hypothetical protein
MIKRTAIFLLMLLSSGFLFASAGRIVFLEGKVDHRNKAGRITAANIGQDILTDDSLITGMDGYCEVEMENGSVISLNSDTVFVFSEIEDREEKGKKRKIFSCIFGSADFKFKKFTGREPYIATPTTICGVRGTDFTVLAGADGSSMYVVASGEVLVEAAGQSVALLPEEGVKVRAGQQPGQKFEVKRDSVDYNAVLQESENRFLDNPSEGMDNMILLLNGYIRDADYWDTLRLENIDKVYAAREQASKIKEEQGEKAWEDFIRNQVSPLEIDTTYLRLNARHYSVSALSMRRYIVGFMYITIRTRYINNTGSIEYLYFISKYNEFMIIFNRGIIEPGYIFEGDF